MNSFPDTNAPRRLLIVFATPPEALKCFPIAKAALVRMAARHTPYGDGQAARRIVEELLHG